jgi:hypothetical protein
MVGTGDKRSSTIFISIDGLFPGFEVLSKSGAVIEWHDAIHIQGILIEELCQIPQTSLLERYNPSQM